MDPGSLKIIHFYFYLWTQRGQMVSSSDSSTHSVRAKSELRLIIILICLILPSSCLYILLSDRSFFMREGGLVGFGGGGGPLEKNWLERGEKIRLKIG